jgi:photosystem II stability/assembly factor-like uncharacterized protein
LGLVFILTEKQLYKSVDNGVTWDSIPLPYLVTSVNIFDPANALFITYDRRTFVSSDSMKTWQIIPGINLLTVAVISPTEAIGFNSINRLFYSDDRGRSWQSKTELPQRNLTAVVMMENDIGCVGTASGEIYKTIDYGGTWVKMPNGVIGGVKNMYEESDTTFLINTELLNYKTGLLL